VAGIAFAKAHALGNDFLLVEEAELGTRDPGLLAKSFCDRRTGVGADGLVVLGRSVAADASFRIYNADGSEAALSGNGLRCAAAWLLERAGKAPVANHQVMLDTRTGVRRLLVLDCGDRGGSEGRAWRFQAEMGAPKFAPAEVPFCPPQPAPQPVLDFALPVGDTTVVITALWMGNPQCIVLVEDFALLDWERMGEDIERHPYFPERTNVGFVRVISRERIEARFWERGAGHTLASGTGSCACALAAHLAGKTSRRVTVEVERGEMGVDWRDDAVVELTGPAEIVAEGVYAG
jgi:diaminopimelate epimerase